MAFEVKDIDRKKILLVDDNRDLVKVLQFALENKGYDVRPACSAAELFASLEGQQPDLIILDIVMPGMNGLEALERLKQSPKTSLIPVLIVTAKVRYEDVLQGYALGADYYMTKPFTIAQLLKGINLTLAKRMSGTHGSDASYETNKAHAAAFWPVTAAEQ